MPRDDFKSIWEEAKGRYTELSGKDLKDIPMARTSEDLLKNIDSQNNQYKGFRETKRALFSILSAAVKPIELVGNLAAGAASAAYPPSQMCFGAAMYLINAAKGVSSTLDAITELLSDLKNYTVRLNIYLKEDLSKELRDKLAEILVTVIEIFGRSTRIVQDSILGRIKMFGKNLLLGNDTTMQGLIAKLNKLTKSEGLLVGAENLVEAKKTGRAVEAVQSSLIEHSTQLSQMAGGMNQILSAVEEARDEAKAAKDLTHLEAVKKMLQPSFLAQDAFDAIKREHVPNSGDWIRSEVQMQAWTRSATPILWVAGNPGSGKSFLAYNIVTYLQMTYQNSLGDEEHVSIGYFFFRDNQDQTRSFEVALRNIAYQIAQTDHVYAKYLEGLSYSSPAVNSIHSAWQKLFVDFFMNGDNSGNTVFIVLDGIDEAFQEGRGNFFDLLNDVQSSGSNSMIHIAMLGRPQIAEEMAESVAGSIPTIHVDRMKTSGDITRYVELSITKSRVLSRVSSPLKSLIVRTLSTKAEGMFMWVKLMIVEIGKKSRESAIKEALNKAPSGLTKMLRHVLEVFSATLSEDDANDFNNMIKWVALAKRPLALGELDAMLRLQCPDGDAVLFLEGKLRKHYACFFTLTREDKLSTADLLNRKPVLDEDEDIQTGPNLVEGLDDVENETDFDSNPSTTTLSFSHSSISEFFRDPKEGKVTATGGEYPAVGIDLGQARLSIANTCVDLVVDGSLLDRMKDAISLRPYAALYFKQHLEDLESSLSADEQINIGTKVANMMRDETLLPVWSGAQNYLFFTENTAKEFLRWIINPGVYDQLRKDEVSWFQSIRENPLELFGPAMMYCSKRWLLPEGAEWIANACVTIISSWLMRKEGQTVNKVPALSVKDIERAALWSAFEKTAEWHRRVGRVLRDQKCYEAAMKYFAIALTMQPGWWLAQAGISRTYVARKQYKEAITSDEMTLNLLESDKSPPSPLERSGLWEIHKRMALSYVSLAGKVEGEFGRDEKLRLLNKALDNYATAFSITNTDYECINDRFTIINQLLKESTKSTSPELLTRGEYYGQVLDILHGMDQMEKSETTSLVKFLNIYYDDEDEDVFELAAAAAVDQDELPWLQGKYREAVAYADAARTEVISAILSLCLAQLYGIYGHDEDRAARIWENVGMAPITSSAVASEIGYARTEALNQFGQYLIRKALQDESGAEKYVNKMERIISRHRYGTRIDTEDSIPPSDVALHLASWYHKMGRDEEAREVVKPHIMDAMIILSDDDPKNDSDGYWTLKQAFIAVGDDRNAFAILHAMRRFKNGMAVIKAANDYKPYDEESDSDDEATHEEEGDDSGGESNSPSRDGSEEDSDDDSDDCSWRCDGCGESWTVCDGMIDCRYCNVDFCSNCHQLLIRGELAKNICGKDHAFVTVPYLTPEQAFKEGEILIDGKAVTMEKWKADVKKQYAL